jgi:hypothetical protein
MTAPRRAATAALVGAALVVLTGCTAVAVGEPAATTTPHAASGAGEVPDSGTLGTGFVDPSQAPAPESTVAPSPGSWDRVHPPADYEVVLLTPGEHGAEDATETRTLVRAVDDWADDEGVHLTRIDATSRDTMLDAVVRAIDARPDLVISVGHDMVDPIAAMSPSALRQQFLVLGAEIAEPTSNVTAADWTGAGFRGEGLGTSSHHDPASFTDERAGRALRAGTAAVLKDVRGVVVWVD